MAKLTNPKCRVCCAACGEILVLEVPELTGTNIIDDWLPAELSSRQWRELGRRLYLCGKHAEASADPTVDELHFLRDKLWAHQTAQRFTLEFYIHNGRVVTETGARPATAQELEMWGVLLRQAKQGRI